MEDDNLRFIFSDGGGNVDNKIDILKKVTADNRDNHSAIIVHVLGVENTSDKIINVQKENTSNVPVKKKRNDVQGMDVTTRTSKRWFWVLLVIGLLMVCGFYVGKYLGLIGLSRVF